MVRLLTFTAAAALLLALPLGFVHAAEECSRQEISPELPWFASAGAHSDSCRSSTSRYDDHTVSASVGSTYVDAGIFDFDEKGNMTIFECDKSGTCTQREAPAEFAATGAYADVSSTPAEVFVTAARERSVLNDPEFQSCFDGVAVFGGVRLLRIQTWQGTEIPLAEC